MADYAEHVVDSVYLFKFPEASEVIEQFSSTPESLDCHTTYKDTKFHLQCPRVKNQQVLSAFMETYTTYINASAKPVEEVDNFELPKVSRIFESVIDDDPSAVYEGARNPKEPDENRGKIDLGVTLIEHESEVRVYRLLSSEEFTVQTLKAVEKLTRCTIIIDKGNGKITLKGDTANDVDIAFGKLTVISKSSSRRTLGFTSFDFYIPENEFNFRFCFHTPEQVIDRHILLYLPNFMSDYTQIHMAKWDSSSASWFRFPKRPKPPRPLKNVLDDPWFQHIYPALGCEKVAIAHIEPLLRKTHDYLAPAQVSKLTTWTENVPLQPEDAFNATPNKDVGILVIYPPVTTLPRDYMKSKRVIKEAHETIPTPRKDDDTNIILQPPPITEPYMPAEAASTEEETEAIALAEPLTVPTVPMYRERGALIDHPEPIAFLPLAPNQSQRVAPWSGAQTIIQHKDDEAEDEQEALRQLNLAQGALRPLTEKVQPDSEAALRLFRRSTNLQVSQAGSVKTEATPVIDRIIKAMSSILELAWTSYGRVTLEIAIGHIYVGKNELGTACVIEQSDWSSTFRTRNGAERVPTFFSRVLTTSWFDAKFVAGLKLPSSISMFSETPGETGVTYVIECVNRHTRQEYRVEVDQTGKSAVYYKPQSIGSVNCHFTKRVWDASFRVTETTLASLDPQDPVKSIADHLWVRSSTLAVLGGRISGGEVSITSVAVRRQKAYACLNNQDLRLRLTEVQDLVLVWRSEQQFQAYAEPRDNMVKHGNRVWWEASITSEAADRTLAENETLELGEVAQWTMDDIVGMYVVHDMFHVAEQVVTRIDSVGCSCLPVLFPPPPSTSKSIAKSASKTSPDKKYGQGWSEW